MITLMLLSKKGWMQMLYQFCVNQFVAIAYMNLSRRWKNLLGKYLSKILSMSCICIYPHIRGGLGIPIFSHNIKMSNHWKLEEAKVYNEEIVRLHYSRVDITEK